MLSFTDPLTESKSIQMKFKSTHFYPNRPIVRSFTLFLLSSLSATPSISASPPSPLLSSLPVAICSKMDVPWEYVGRCGGGGGTSLRLLLQLRQQRLPRFRREWGKSLERVNLKFTVEVSRWSFSYVPIPETLEKAFNYRLVQKKGPVLLSTSQAQQGRTF